MGIDMQLPQLSQEMASLMRGNGYKACQMALYSTKPSDVLHRVVLEAARTSLHPHSIVDLVAYEKRIHVLRPRMQAHFINGAYSLVADDRPKPVQGTYLRIMCPILESAAETLEASEASVRGAIENCAALVSLMHGEFVALERHYNAKIVLNPRSSSVQTEGYFVRQTIDGEQLNQNMAHIFDEQGDSGLQINSRAMSLINRAHHEFDDTNKFLFMWLALEVVLGSGAARKKFALDTMRSEPLNEAIKDLRKMRDDLVHDGIFIRLTHTVFLRAKCIILMGMTKNEITRGRLLNYLLSELSL